MDEKKDAEPNSPTYERLTILSGGQTGADRAALDFAIAHGIACGGWCPRGRLAEDGPIPAEYPLQETTSRRYAQRTEWNIRDADATILLTVSPTLQGGTALTARLAEKLGKPWLHLCRDGGDSVEVLGVRLRVFVSEHNACRINIAGPRASQEPAVGQFVCHVLQTALLGDDALS